MSQTIDDKIVKLEFENQGFEQGVSESLTTLQKLKNALQLDGAAKNLTALGNAASKFNLDGISTAVEQVGEKFSYMKYAGLVAISNLVTGAMQAGSRIVNALTGPIITGGWNRAMNLEQANFMMKGLLKDEDAVAAVMDNVSESVDGTAYSLDAAAKVAAQFSASGVKAGEGMLSSLKAVAGTAAMTNSSFEEIGSIFTTVAGQGKLMAYQMNQLSFRGLNAAATLGEQLGKSEAEIREMVSKGQISFQMFSDAMNAAFGEHAKEANNTFQGALSNVKSALGRIGAEFATPFIHNIIPVLNSFRLAINATKKTLTPFFETSSSIMEAMSKKISAMLDRYTEFVDKHGDNIRSIFKDLINTAKNVFNFLQKAISPIKEAFNSTFKSKTIGYIKKLSVMIVKLSSRLTVTGEAADKIKNIFKGFFSIFDTVGFVIKRIVSQFKNFTPVIKQVSSYLVDGLTKISNGLLKINSKVKNSEFLNSDFLKVPDKLKEILSDIPNIGDRIKEAFDKIKTTIKQTFEKGLIDPAKFKTNMDSIKTFFEGLLNTVSNIFKKFGDVLQNILNGSSNIVDAIVRIIEGLFNSIARAIQGFLSSQTIKDLMEFAKSSVFIAILNELREFISRSRGLSLDKIFNFNFKLIDLSPLNSLVSTIKNLGENMVDAQLIRAVGAALMELALSLLILSTIEPDALKRSVIAISTIVAELGGIVAGVNALAIKLGADGLMAFSKLTDTFKTMATSILMLAAAVALLSFIDIDKLIASVAAIGALCAMMIIASEKLSMAVGKILKAAGRYNKLAPKIIKRYSQVLMNFAKSLLVLSVALKILSTIPLSNMIDALIALTVILSEMLLFLKLYQKVGVTEESSRALIALGAALLILSLSLKLLSTIPLSDMGTALLGLAGGLGAMVATLAILSGVMKGFQKGVKKGVSLDFNKLSASILILSLALIPLSASLKILSTISLDDMGTALLGLSVGLLSMVAAMTTLAVVMKAFYAGADLGANLSFAKLAASLLILSVALIPLALALKLISTIPYDQMAGTMINFAVGLGAMVASLWILSKIPASKLFAAAGALNLLSIAVVALSVSLWMIKDIQPMDIVYSLGALAVAIGVLALMFGVIGVAADKVALGALAVLAIFAAFAGGISLIGLSLMVLGSGLTALSVGLGALALGFTSLTDAMAAAGDNLDVITKVSFRVLGIFAAFIASFALLTPFIIVASIGILALAGGLTVFGYAIGIVGTGVELLGHGFDAIGVGISSITTELGELLKLLADSSKDIKGIAKTSFVLLGIFAAFTVTLGLLSPFILLASAGIAALAIGFALVGAAMIVIGTGLTYIGNGFTAMQVGLDNLSKGLQSFITFLTQIPKDMGAAAKGAFIFLGVLAAFAVALTIITPFLLIGAVGVLAFGAALIVLGLGMENVGNGLTLISNGLILFSQAMEQIGPIVETIIGVVILIFAKLKELVLKFIDWFKSIDWAAVWQKIVEALKAIVTKIGELLKKAWEWLKENFPIWMDAISEKLKEWWEGLKEAIHQKWEEFKASIASKWEEFKNEIGKWKDDLIEKGKFIIQGLIDGIFSAWDDIKAIPGMIKDVIIGGTEKEFEIDSPSKAMWYEGLFIGQGLTNGIEDGTAGLDGVIGGIKDQILGGLGPVGQGVAKIFGIDWTQATKAAEGSLSDLLTKMQDHANYSVKELAPSVTEVWKNIETLSLQLQDVNEKYATGQMRQSEYEVVSESLKQRIIELVGSYEDLEAAMKDVTYQESVLKKEEHELRDAIAKGTGNISENTSKLKANIDAQKALREAKTAVEIANKANTQSTKDETNALDENTTATNTNASSKKSAAEANKELSDSLKSTLESQLDIFKKFEAKNPMNKDELLNNMRSQIKGMTDWAAQMNKLATMGIDQGLYKKLAEMGPQGAEYVGAFTQMTAEELAQANEMWAQSLVLPGDVAGQLTNDFNNIGVNIDKGLANGITGNAGEVKDATTKTVQENTTDTAMDVVEEKSPSKVFHRIGMNIDLGLALGIQDFRNVVYVVVETMCRTIVDIAKRELDPENFKPIGVGVVEGLKSGIEETASEIETIMTELGKKMNDAIKSKDALNEKSPSHTMEEIGKYAVMGLAKGITDNSSIAIRSTEGMGNDVIEAMKYTVANIAAMVNDEMIQPVITPVLDLSKVQEGARLLNSSFSSNAAIGVGASQLSALQNGQPIGGNVIFNQNNYSPKSISRYDIYRDTRNLLSQYKQATR